MVGGPRDPDGTAPDDLPTEAVPSWPGPPKAPTPPAGASTDDVWAMSAPGADLPPLPADGTGPPAIPPPEPTKVMPVVPPPHAPPAPPPPVLPLSPTPGGGEPPRRGKGWIIGAVVAVVAVLGALVAIVVLRNDDSTTDGDTDAATTTVPVPSTPPVTDPVTVPPTAPPTEAPTTTDEVTTTTIEETTTTVAGPTWPAGLRVAVAAADGVHVAQETGADVAVAEQVSIAFALPGGGFLVQDNGGRYDQNSGAPIAPGATAIRVAGVSGGVLLAPVGEQWLTLHDVGTLDGALVAVVSIGTGSTIEDQEEELVLVPVNGGTTRSVGIIGGWESATGRLHLGGRGIVGESFVEALSGPLLLTVDGGQLVDPAVLGLQREYSRACRR
jgi:hypothetical protein